MNKSLLRTEMKETLSTIKKASERSEDLLEYYNELSHEIDISAIAVYIPNDLECDVLPLVEQCWDDDIDVFVLEYPKKGDDFSLIPWFSSSNIVKVGGARLPLEDERFEISEVDVILVPGLAFTDQGQRLGRGAGFYDQVLEDFDGLSIGVCYKEQLLEELPLEEHDMSVDTIWAV